MSKETNKAWQQANPEKCREYARRTNNKTRKKVLEQYGNVCKHCKFADVRALQLDHIEGGGVAERRKLHTSAAVMRRALKYPDKYQLLCANCNWIKRFERGEHS